jgi:hypothetical protein
VIIACGVFRGCSSLCELIFDIPSRLKQLDLPSSEFGILYIPDCAEVVFGGIGKQEGQLRLLHFDGESRLMQISLRHPVHVRSINQSADTESDSFVHLPEKVLRRFRFQFECL